MPRLHSDRHLARPPSPATRPPGPTAPSRVFPGLRELIDPRGPFLVPLALLLVSRAILLLGTPAPAEDAFITFRYARNLATGQGLVYNAGEHVMGFTSPLWTVWSALGIVVTGSPIAWALAWSFVADIVTLLAGGVLVSATAGAASAWAFTFFFAAWPYFSALMVSGMETSLFVTLLVLAAALVHAKSRAAGPTLAALALTRPEGLVAALVLSLAASWRDRLVALAITAAGLVLLALQFGSPIPNSLRVKASVYGTPGPWIGRHWWEWISPVVMGRWPSNGDTIVMMFLAVVTAPAAIVGARELWRRRDTAMARLAAAALVIWLGYAGLGVAYFWWYYALPLVATALLVAVGLPRVTRGRAIPIALALYTLSIWSVSLSLYRGRSHQEIQNFGAMAGTLRDRCRPGDSVFLEPIGMIGFTCPVTVIDEAGLVSPDVARCRMQGPGWYTDIVNTRTPRWLVVRRGVLDSENAFAGAGRPFRDTAERDALLARYAQVDRTGEPGAATELLLLERR